MSTITFAGTFNQVTNEDSNIVVIDKEITKDEFVNRISEAEKISKKLASEKVEAMNKEYEVKKMTEMSKQITLFASGFTTYHEYILIKDFGLNQKVEAGVVYSQYNYLSFREIIGVSSPWEIEISSGAYSFQTAYHNYQFTGSSISQQVRGSVTTPVDMSLSGSADLKQKLLGAGFTVSTTVGTTWYFRKLATWTGTLSIY